MSDYTISVEGAELVLEGADGKEIALSLSDVFEAMGGKVLAAECSERIRSNADNDIIDLLDAFDDDIIEEEAKNRNIFGGSFSDLSSWDAEKLRHAILNDDGRRVIDLMRPLVGSAF